MTFTQKRLRVYHSVILRTTRTEKSRVGIERSLWVSLRPTLERAKRLRIRPGESTRLKRKFFRERGVAPRQRAKPIGDVG